MKNYKEVLHLMKLHISDLTFVSNNNVLGKDLAQQMFYFSQIVSEGEHKILYIVVPFLIPSTITCMYDSNHRKNSEIERKLIDSVRDYVKCINYFK